MPLSKLEHEQLASALREMSYIKGEDGNGDYIYKDAVFFLISRYTQEFYDEYQEGISETHGGTD